MNEFNECEKMSMMQEPNNLKNRKSMVQKLNQNKVLNSTFVDYSGNKSYKEIFNQKPF